MISGYYTFMEEKSEELQRIKKALYKIVRLAIIVALIYSLSNTIDNLSSGDFMFEWLVSYMTLCNILELVLFNHSVFITAIMWYFLAVIYVYLIMIIALKMNLVSGLYIHCDSIIVFECFCRRSVKVSLVCIR
jgi:hypothetical protein